MEININSIKTDAGKLEEYIGNIEEAVNNLSNNIDNSQDNFKGDRADTAYIISTNFIGEIKELVSNMKDYKNFLSGVAEAYELLDSEYASKSIEM